MSYPEWVEQYRGAGKEIKQIHIRFYLYERKTVWDKDKKQPMKISGAYLDRITEGGLLPPKKLMPPCGGERQNLTNFRLILPQYEQILQQFIHLLYYRHYIVPNYRRNPFKTVRRSSMFLCFGSIRVYRIRLPPACTMGVLPIVSILCSKELPSL